MGDGVGETPSLELGVGKWGGIMAENTHWNPRGQIPGTTTAPHPPVTPAKQGTHWWARRLTRHANMHTLMPTAAHQSAPCPERFGRSLGPQGQESGSTQHILRLYTHIGLGACP